MLGLVPVLPPLDFSTLRGELGASPPYNLRPGVLAQVGECSCKIISLLGQGSFGSVWTAWHNDDEGLGGQMVAVKEMMCLSERDFTIAAREIKTLTDLADRLAEDALSADCSVRKAPYASATTIEPLLRVPSLVSSEVVQEGQSLWRARLVMTRLDGVSLESFLCKQREDLQQESQSMPDVESRLVDACLFARELIIQVSETLENISRHFLHRDVNSRNILVSNGEDLAPRFSLVDFGMAIDAHTWVGSKGPGSWHETDIAGDCRFWPPSSWLFFEFGWSGLKKHPALCSEYQNRLDVHALGVTALWALMESLPSSPSRESSLKTRFERTEAPLMQGVRALKMSWEQYWSYALRIWERVQDCMRTGRNPEKLRKEFINCEVHEVFARNLRGLGIALHNAESACRRAVPHSLLAVEAGILFSALRLMIGEDSECECSWPCVRSKLDGSHTAHVPGAPGSLGPPGCGVGGCGPALSFMNIWSIAFGCSMTSSEDIRVTA